MTGGLVFFFDVYATVEEDRGLQQCIDDIFRERFKAPFESATLDLPLAGLNQKIEEENSPSIDKMPLARYGALAGLFGDDPLLEYAQAVQAVASSVARLKATVRHGDAIEESAKYRRSLLVRDIRSPSASLTNKQDLNAAAETALGALEASFFACIPRLIRRTGVELADADDGTTDDEIGLVFLRALGLLSHAERACNNFLSQDGAVARALFLAAAQLRAVAATEPMRAFAAATARALYQVISKPLPPKTFAVFAAAAALDTDFNKGLDASVCRGEENTREYNPSQRGSIIFEARDLPPRLVDAAHRTIAWLENAGCGWCQEHDLTDKICPLLRIIAADKEKIKRTASLESTTGLNRKEDNEQVLLPENIPLVAMWPVDICDECQSRRDDAEILAAALGFPPPCAVCKQNKRSKPAQLAVRSWRLFTSSSINAEQTRFYDYLEPGEMRCRLERLLTERGEKALDNLLDSDPTLFFVFLWFCARLHVPLPMRAGPRARCIIALVQGDEPDIVLQTCNTLLTGSFLPPNITDVASPPTSPSSSKRQRSTSTTGRKSISTTKQLPPDPVDICRRVFGDVDPQRVNFVFC